MISDITYETIDGHKFMVIKPIEELDNLAYDKMKPHMESMGGHWRERVKGFVFNIQTLERTSHSEYVEKIQFFPTPEPVANKMIDVSGVLEFNPDNKPFILEPSAGKGALLDALDNYAGNRRYRREIVVEPVEENANILRSKGHYVEEMTFEKFYHRNKKNKEFRFTHVFMNPPFSGGCEATHTMMAYNMLQPNGTLVGIVSENSLYYKDQVYLEFQQWLKEVKAEIIPVEHGSFRESGTTVDTVIIKIAKGA